VATIYDEAKETIRTHLTLVHVFVTPHVIKSLIKSLKLQLSLKERGNQVVEV
jgi:hypothetical protein